jgi:hypothetical protein
MCAAASTSGQPVIHGGRSASVGRSSDCQWHARSGAGGLHASHNAERGCLFDSKHMPERGRVCAYWLASGVSGRDRAIHQWRPAELGVRTGDGSLEGVACPTAIRCFAVGRGTGGQGSSGVVVPITSGTSAVPNTLWGPPMSLRLSARRSTNVSQRAHRPEPTGCPRARTGSLGGSLPSWERRGWGDLLPRQTQVFRGRRYRR